jgi:hypothetical protein
MLLETCVAPIQLRIINKMFNKKTDYSINKLKMRLVGLIMQDANYIIKVAIAT